MNKQSTTIAHKTRTTKETNIDLKFGLMYQKENTITCGIPFFEHMLHSFALHGNFHLEISARGDLAIDYHHTVEDIGIVLGSVIADLQKSMTNFTRFGYALIPMDDSLSEVAIDLCNRPYVVYKPIFPQQTIRDFDTALLKEFFEAVALRAKINLHLIVRHAQNSHHAAESLFKAFGKALAMAFSPSKTTPKVPSTKGIL